MPTAVPATETAFLADSFEQLDDPRDEETYPLREVLVRAVRATVSGADVANRVWTGSETVCRVVLAWFTRNGRPAVSFIRWKRSLIFPLREELFMSGRTGALGDSRVYRTTVPPSFERGGAPLLNHRDQVVGVLLPTSQEQGLSQSGPSTEPISYAVRSRYLRQLRAELNRDPEASKRVPGRRAFARHQSSLRPLLERVSPSVLPVTAR